MDQLVFDQQNVLMGVDLILYFVGDAYFIIFFLTSCVM